MNRTQLILKRIGMETFKTAILGVLIILFIWIVLVGIMLFIKTTVNSYKVEMRKYKMNAATVVTKKDFWRWLKKRNKR